MPVRNTPFSEVVGGQFHVDAVAHQNTDAVTTHSPGDGREDHMVRIFYLYLKEGVWLLVDHRADHFDQFFFHYPPRPGCFSSVGRSILWAYPPPVSFPEQTPGISCNKSEVTGFSEVSEQGVSWTHFANIIAANR